MITAFFLAGDYVKFRDRVALLAPRPKDRIILFHPNSGFGFFRVVVYILGTEIALQFDNALDPQTFVTDFPDAVEVDLIGIDSDSGRS